jgi:S-adenosylmethionine:diacylglycerol 3-amino-3-carboxypropyl transferase
MTTAAAETAWERGRFDSRIGPGRVLFGRMYEDASIEIGAFRPGGRIFCIASAGCTAIELAPSHEVVAADINPVQLDYARRRLEGGATIRGAAERFMAFGRFLAPLVGWRAAHVTDFLDLADPGEQIAFWRRHLDTRRFRTGFDTLMSAGTLRAVYAPAFVNFMPRRMGSVMRGRMERCFARHPNRTNPYARAILLGELPGKLPSAANPAIRLVHAEAADFLEKQPAGSFDGFTLSNILDGASEAYGKRLFAAVRRAAAPGAVVVLRSFAEPRGMEPTNQAQQDRSILWGIVDVKAVEAL